MPRKGGKPTEKQLAALRAHQAPQWEPGQSGNPEGSKPGYKHRSTYLAKYGDAVYKSRDGKIKTNPFDDTDLAALTVEELGDLALIKKMLAGDIAAYKEYKDSRYGKIKEVHEIIPPDLTKKEVDEMTDEEAAARYESLARN